MTEGCPLGSLQLGQGRVVVMMASGCVQDSTGREGAMAVSPTLPSNQQMVLAQTITIITFSVLSPENKEWQRLNL